MFQHLLITRYSVTHLPSPVQRWIARSDALDETRLAHRFEYFRFATFASVAAQTDQAFDWLILVDPELPLHWRMHLEELTSGRPRTHVVGLPPRTRIWRGRWLEPWLLNQPQSIATTLLDDDDALPRVFSERLRQLVHNAFPGGHIAYPCIFGFLHSVQWDLDFDGPAPLGAASDWHRRRKDRTRYPSACGLTLLVPGRHFDLSVLGLEHACADRMFEPRFQPASRQQRNAARLLRAAARRAGQDPSAYTSVCSFRALDGHVPAPLVLNHGYNNQARRLYERKSGMRPVSGDLSFPDVAIDWQAVRAYARALRQP